MVRQPYARVNYIPQSGTKNLATGHQERVYSIEENPGFIPPFFILHPVKRFLYREPECLSNRLNWVPHLLSASECGSPSRTNWGGAKLACGEGVGGTQFRRLDRHSSTLRMSNSNPFTLHPTMCRFLDDFLP
jgi:hypothetical protein